MTDIAAHTSDCWDAASAARCNGSDFNNPLEVRGRRGRDLALETDDVGQQSCGDQT